MSVAEIERFNADLKAKPALLAALKGHAASLSSIVSFAVSRGYEVTVDDVRAAVRAAKSDLSDEAIDKIAAGGVPMLIIVPIPLMDADARLGPGQGIPSNTAVIFANLV